jgi:hypothetical protein
MAMDSIAISNHADGSVWHELATEGLPDSPRAVFWVMAEGAYAPTVATFVPPGAGYREGFHPYSLAVTHWRLFDRPPPPGQDTEQARLERELEQAMDELQQALTIVERLRDYRDQIERVKDLATIRAVCGEIDSILDV